MIVRFAIAALLAIAVAAPSAGAATPWRDVTGDTNTSLTAVASVRSGETGPLHVTWVAPGTDPNNSNVLYARDILPSGALGPVRTITTADGTGGFTNPSIARNPVDGRLWIYAAGSSTFAGRLFAMNSADGGATWTAREPISTSEYAYAPNNSSAVFAADGTAYQSFGEHLKRTTGIDATEDKMTEAPGIAVDFPTCCLYWSQLAIDAATNAAYVGWFSNGTARAGFEVVSVADGAVTYVPGSANADRSGSTNGDTPTPITGRIGAPGVFVAACNGYPTCTRAQVWRLGTAKPITVGTGKDIRIAQVSPAPGGRLWAYWTTKGQLWARRSNPAGTVYGATVNVPLPKSADTYVWKLAGNGAAGYLDALVSLRLGNVDTTQTTRILPGLSVTAPSKVKSGVTYAFRVTDAGVPVPGATVRLRGKLAKTDAKGIAKVLVAGTAGSAKVTATRAGFVAASTSTVVRVP